MTTQSKITDIVRLRGIAVLGVLLYHVGILPPFFQGWTGVDLFFVISGFVISLSLLKNEKLHTRRSWLGQFYLRRVVRIGIPVLAILLWVTWRTKSFRTFLYVLTLQLNYRLVDMPGIFADHLWSLVVEEHFYICLPIFFLMVRSTLYRLIFAAGAVLAVVLLKTFHPNPSFLQFRYETHLRLDALLAGVSLALVDLSHLNARLARLRPCLLVIVPLLCGVLFCLPAGVSDESLCRYGFTTLTATSVVLVLLAGLRLNLIFPWKGVSHSLEYLGERSFSLYLTHMFVIAYASRWSLGSAGMTLGILAVGEIFYCLVERPALLFSSRIPDILVEPPRVQRVVFSNSKS